jgi:predicted nucleic acid-binding protein
VIVYLDSSVVAQALLPDEAGHARARRVLYDVDAAAITWRGTMTEVTGALVRASRAGRVAERAALAALAAVVGDRGPITLVDPLPDLLHERAVRHARAGLHALDAYHLAVAELTLPQLAEGHEARLFATRDRAHADAVRAAAARLGFTPA